MLASGVLLGFAPVTNAALRKFGNCQAMNNVYPHGVGISGSVDRTTEKVRVKNFRVDAELYRAQSKNLDRDGDGIACEKL